MDKLDPWEPSGSYREVSGSPDSTFRDGAVTGVSAQAGVGPGWSMLWRMGHLSQTVTLPAWWVPLITMAAQLPASGFKFQGVWWWSPGPVGLRCLVCFNNKHLQTLLYMPLSALQYSYTNLKNRQIGKSTHAFTHETCTQHMHLTPKTPVPNLCLRQDQDPRIYKTRSHPDGRPLGFCGIWSLMLNDALLIKWNIQRDHTSCCFAFKSLARPL